MNNPKFAYYKALYAFLSAPKYIEVAAKEIVELQNKQGCNVSLGYDLETLKNLHGMMEDEQDRVKTSEAETIMVSFIADMTAQIRSNAVQQLLVKLQGFLGYGESLMAFARHVKPVGTDQMAMVTMFVSDWRLFQLVMNPRYLSLDIGDLDGKKVGSVRTMKAPDVIIFEHNIPVQ